MTEITRKEVADRIDDGDIASLLTEIDHHHHGDVNRAYALVWDHINRSPFKRITDRADKLFKRFIARLPKEQS